MIINLRNTCTITFDPTRTGLQPPPLRLGNHSVPCVQSAKVLGVWISNDLSWSKHTSELIRRASKRIYYLKALKQVHVDCSSLRLVYVQYVRPISEYGSVTWHHSITTAQSAEIERLQKRACRIILGQRYSSYDHALRELDLETLQQRRCTTFKSAAKSFATKSRTSHLLPTRPYSRYGLRSHELYQVPDCRYCLGNEVGASHDEGTTQQSI